MEVPRLGVESDLGVQGGGSPGTPLADTEGQVHRFDGPFIGGTHVKDLGSSPEQLKLRANRTMMLDREKPKVVSNRSLQMNHSHSNARSEPPL